MRLVEGVFGEIGHLVKDAVCHRFGDSVRKAAGNSRLRVAVHKILPLLGHHLCLFLTHGAAHQVASAVAVSGEVTHDLHNLLLVHDAAVGRLQNGPQLLALVGDMLLIVLALDVLRNEIHGTRAIEADAGDDILKALRLQLLHKGFHSRAFQLEDALGLAGGEKLIHFRVIVGYRIDGKCRIFLPGHLLRILYYREGAKPQEIHLEKA